MNFLEALKYSYENRANTEEFTNPFFLYCRLSDLCGSVYEDKRKVAMFYQVNKKLNIVQALLQRDESVENKYQEVADIIAESNFQKLIEMVKSVIYCECKEEGNVKRQMQEKVDVRKAANKAEECETTPCSNSETDGGNCAVAWLSVVLGLILAIGVVALCAFVFR